MLIEITRFRRRFLTPSGSNSAAAVVWVLVAICYLCLILLVLSAGKDLDPMILVVVQTGLFTIAAPMMLHSAIAGERERRSWDLLLAAPITKSQIVVGKFIGALAALGVGAAAFTIPVAIAALRYERTLWWNLWLAEALSLSFVILVCTVTLFFSARVKRSFMALGASLGSLFVGVVILPALIDVLLGPMARYVDDVVLYLHPFYVLERVMTTHHPDEYIPITWYGVPQVGVYLFFSVVVLSWTIQTLNFAENEVKFIPKGKA
jgi:ABC-type transport system involved in multi-copper enzyme maturation permease subunit